jgi:hypothetical protein
MAKPKQPSLTTPQQIDAEREQRGRTRSRRLLICRLLDEACSPGCHQARSPVARQLAEVITSTDFDANFYQRAYTLAG